MAQERIDAYVHAGITLGQIDGDNSGSYNHAGLHAGVGTSFALTADKRNPFRMIVEINYANKGSYVKSIDRTIDLSYVELPLMLSYTMDQFRAAAGVAPALLVRSSVSASGVYDPASSDNYRRFDRLPLTAELRYKLKSGLFVSGRWQSSMLTIAHESGTGTYRLFRSNKGQFHRLVTLSIGYQF